MNSFFVSYVCFDKSYSGNLVITSSCLSFNFNNEKIIVFHYNNQLYIKFDNQIENIDHLYMYKEDRTKYVDYKERYTLSIITKTLKRYDFCFNIKNHCDICMEEIKKSE